MDADVIVVGGGLAGLVAARDLEREGVHVLLLEARDRLGGRAWARRFADTGVNVELGGEFFSRAAQPAIAQEIWRYGLRVRERARLRSYAWATGGEVRTEPTVADEQRAALVAAAPSLVAAAERVEAAVRPSDVADLDVPAEGWIEALDVPRQTKDLLLALTAVVVGGPPGEVSALGVVRDLAAGLAPADLVSEVGEALADGTSALVDALATDGGAEVRLSTPVRSIRQEGTAVTVLTDAESLRAAAAVVALPLNVLADVSFEPPLSEAKARAAAERHAGHVVKVWALADGVPEGVLAFGRELPLHTTFDERGLDGRRLLMSLGGPGAVHHPVDPAAVQEALRRAIPQARVHRVDAHDWAADPWSRGTWAAWRPGWAGILDELSRPEGRLAFAGADVSRQAPGTMEGAVATGREAASEVRAIFVRDRSGRDQPETRAPSL